MTTSDQDRALDRLAASGDGLEVHPQPNGDLRVHVISPASEREARWHTGAQDRRATYARATITVPPDGRTHQEN